MRKKFFLICSVFILSAIDLNIINIFADDNPCTYNFFMTYNDGDSWNYTRKWKSNNPFSLLFVDYGNNYGIKMLFPTAEYNYAMGGAVNYGTDETSANFEESNFDCYGGKLESTLIIGNSQFYTGSFILNPAVKEVNGFQSKFKSNVPVYVINYMDYERGLYDNAKEYSFDSSGSLVFKDVVYDLEIPLNVNVDVSGKKTTITWEQSNDIDVQGWETEIYVNQTGYTKKQFWSKKVKYDSNWLFADEVFNYKNKYTYKGIMMPVVEDYLKNNLGYDPHVREVQKSNFMIRNKYVDESAGITHYSNFVKFDQDGNAYVYYATEVSSEDIQDLIGSGSEITSETLDAATDTNSDYYNGEQTSSFNQATNVDIIDFFSKFSDMIGNIPDLFNKIFSFMPDECLLFIALGISLIVVLRILGR